MRDLRNGSRRVEVDWIDSTSHDGWDDEHKVLAESEQDDYMTCCTIGYLIKETDELVMLAGSLSTSGPRSRNVGHVMSIPKSAIVARRELRR